MLRVEGLSCERDRRQLFSDLSFNVTAGEILQVVGANGTGKTTLLKILMGLFTDYEGEVTWSLERPPVFLSHNPGVKDTLTVEENLSWLCRLHGVTISDASLHDALQRTGLSGYEHSLCRSLSEGQRKRVNLARFHLLSNDCWVMDEPFSSIDAAGIKQLEAKLTEQAEQGGAVILSSHQPLSIGESIRRLEL